LSQKCCCATCVAVRVGLGSAGVAVGARVGTAFGADVGLVVGLPIATSVSTLDDVRAFVVGGRGATSVGVPPPSGVITFGVETIVPGLGRTVGGNPTGVGAMTVGITA